MKDGSEASQWGEVGIKAEPSLRNKHSKLRLSGDEEEVKLRGNMNRL